MSLQAVGFAVDFVLRIFYTGFTSTVQYLFSRLDIHQSGTVGYCVPAFATTQFYTVPPPAVSLNTTRVPGSHKNMLSPASAQSKARFRHKHTLLLILPPQLHNRQPPFDIFFFATPLVVSPYLVRRLFCWQFPCRNPKLPVWFGIVVSTLICN
jgi:hypothetical protein